MRAHSESVLTVIEVFIHDPLYRWALTVPQAHARQAGNEGGGLSEGPGAAGVINADAERTILRIKQKLRGAEGGEPWTAARLPGEGLEVVHPAADLPAHALLTLWPQS